MDASQLTYEKHSRAVYVAFLARQAEINDRNQRGIPRPVESISPVGSDGPDYTNWYNYVLTGPLFIPKPTVSALPAPPPVPPLPIVSNYSYIVLEDPGDTWTWRVYNIYAGTWSASVNSGYSVTDNPNTRICSLSNCFILYMIGPSPDYNNNAFLFVGIDGTLLQTITNINASGGGYYYQQTSAPFLHYTYSSNSDAPPAYTYTFNLYNSVTNTVLAPYTLNTDTLIDAYTLDNAIVFYVYSMGTNLTTVYSWGLSNTTPSIVCTIVGSENYTTDVSYEQSGLDGPTFNNSSIFIDFTTGNIYVITQDGTYATYSTSVTTYNSRSIYYYGAGNLQNCAIVLHKSNDNSYDVYVFPIATTYTNGAILTPVVLTEIGRVRYHSCVSYGPALPTYGSNHIVIYDTNDGAKFIGANVYIIFNGTTLVGPLFYNNSPNTVGSRALINNNGVCLLESTGSSVNAHIITPTLNTTILLPYYTTDCYPYVIGSMIGYFVLYGNNTAEGGYFLSIINSQTGALAYSNVPSNSGLQYQLIDQYAGSNLLAYDYTHHNILAFINGTATVISWSDLSQVYQYPEYADGVTFTLNATTSRVFITNSSGYMTVEPTIPPATVDGYGGIGKYYYSYIVSPNIAVNIIDMSGVNYYYENTALTGYTPAGYGVQFTEKSLMFWFVGSGGAPQIYIGFSTVTNTFDNTFTDNGSGPPSMLTNDPYAAYY